MNAPRKEENKREFVLMTKKTLLSTFVVELLITLLAFFLSSRGGWLSLLGILVFLIAGCLLIIIGILFLNLFLAGKATEIEKDVSPLEKIGPFMAHQQFGWTLHIPLLPDERKVDEQGPPDDA